MIIAVNKRGYFDYQILKTYETGIELKGFEVKSIKNGKINLASSYAVLKNGEVWLINVDVAPYQQKNTPANYDSKRNRRLLLKKNEIKELIGKVQEKGLTLVPLKVYTKNQKIKIEIGLARSRRKIDKRELIKKREAKKEIQKLKF